MIFSLKILLWYQKNKRNLPWRKTKDPYRIWLSEIILQQTRVAQGLPYYERFIERFPTVRDLANAQENEVLKLWQGLGYYSRARNLHATAKIVVDEYKGEFPKTYKGLLKLKGVGDYTASAIASICFDIPEPVVDGNVYRVLARYYGVDIPINSSKGTRYFKELARKVMNTEQIRDYNQAIMEFGAIQCAPKNPDCTGCPLNDGCLALQQNQIGELPKKINKTKVRNRYFNYLVVVDPKNRTLLQQRKGKGIWQNLWEFPLLESKEDMDVHELERSFNKVLAINETPEIYHFNSENIVHKLSHQHLYTKFWIIKTDTFLKEGVGFNELKDYPVPVLIADFIKTFKI
ncbi:A/G-specific adenine glycosylase [Maribacter luteus]|uniref:Adenine DNA glycosylase n=1 Tax=Maribacter luteus TaxID=2594478 RepID=A0A6I2MGS9_9FLAO|nr:A/G-specific adenine glycosylase [Maribacter luteus]MRX62918.1 A/G-specific adenine glycosylase [Maribacter luteus]|tara:strand:- start:9936 stop:10973 length:1038 start_codon:yes stop_codon:yes gene_type:complete